VRGLRLGVGKIRKKAEKGVPQRGNCQPGTEKADRFRDQEEDKDRINPGLRSWVALESKTGSETKEVTQVVAAEKTKTRDSLVQKRKKKTTLPSRKGGENGGREFEGCGGGGLAAWPAVGGQAKKPFAG